MSKVNRVSPDGASNVWCEEVWYAECPKCKEVTEGMESRPEWGTELQCERCQTLFTVIEGDEMSEEDGA